MLCSSTLASYCTYHLLGVQCLLHLLGLDVDGWRVLKLRKTIHLAIELLFMFKNQNVNTKFFGTLFVRLKK